MFSTNTIAKLAGINNFVLNEANPSGSKYTDEQIIELFKKVELGIRQNDELFKLNKKFFGGIDKTAEEKAEEDQKKQEEKDKAHDEDEKAKADRDDKKSAESYDALKKQVREYFTDDSLYEYKHRQFFTSSISSSFNSIADKEQSLETKPFISKWLANGEEFVFIRRVLMSTVKAMADFINSGNGKFKAKDFGDYVNSLLQHQQIKQNVYEKTVDNYQALEAWTEANKDKPLIDVVNENKELIKLIIKKADFFAEDGSEPRPLYTIGRSTTFLLDLLIISNLRSKVANLLKHLNMQIKAKTKSLFGTMVFIQQHH
jgi:flagellar motor protein MotB